MNVVEFPVKNNSLKPLVEKFMEAYLTNKVSSALIITLTEDGRLVFGEGYLDTNKAMPVSQVIGILELVKNQLMYPDEMVEEESI
ncbi:MAG: hypothetical protein EBR82_46440 [Caulobacteraceae bacterium]|nr:hypothetical protein [Caulobacteraceae bacterium]